MKNSNIYEQMTFMIAHAEVCDFLFIQFEGAVSTGSIMIALQQEVRFIEANRNPWDFPL